MAIPSLTSTREWLLWSLSIVYLFGFTSLFVQIPGLFGEHGISPAEQVVVKEAESVEDFITNKPTLLRLLPKIGLDLDLGLDFLCVGGLIVSFVSIISRDHRNAMVAGLQWIFYLSIVQVGHVFLSYKWDNLLLEVGFVAIFMAPLGIFGFHDDPYNVIQLKSRPRRPVNHSGYLGNERLVFWLVRWILFRVVLAEALTGLEDIFGAEEGIYSFQDAVQNLMHLHENILLPTPATWLLEYLPNTLVAVAVGFHLLSRLVVCTMVVLPSKQLHLLAFYWMLMTTLVQIIFSNQGFYPLLIITISFSLLDDDWFAGWKRYFWKTPSDTHHTAAVIENGKPETEVQRNAGSSVTSSSSAKDHPKNAKTSTSEHLKKNSTCGTALKVVVCFLVGAAILFLYGFPALTHSEGGDEGEEEEDGMNDVPCVVSVLAVILESIHSLTGLLILVSMLIAGTSLFFECAVAIKRQWFFGPTKRWNQTVSYLKSVSSCCLVASLFAMSLVPLTWYDGQESGQYLPSELQQAYLWTHKHYKLVNNYVTASKRVEINGSPVGRLEVVLEGSQSLDESDWLEYSFKFKPSGVYMAPPFVAPHHPRLDETMHYASRDSYKEHHWILNLVYRLLNNQEEVLELLEDNPFPDNPPKYIKASLYEYKFNINNNNDDNDDDDDDGNDDKSDDDDDDNKEKSPSSAWWIRSWVGYYLPVLSMKDPKFSEYLKLSGIIRIEDPSKLQSREAGCKHSNVLGSFLYFVRSLLGHSNGSCLCLVLISLAFLLAYVDVSSSSPYSPPSSSTLRGKSPRHNPLQTTTPFSNAGNKYTANKSGDESAPRQHGPSKVINVPIQYIDKTRK